MIRPLTLVAMLLAAGSGLYLYQVKHQAQLLDEQIAHILKDTDHVRQHTGELVAEYALLNDPARLQDLATAHLHLRPTEPAQFTNLAELGHRLPAPGAPRPAAPDPAPATTPATAPAVAAIPAPIVVAALPPAAPSRPAPRPRTPVTPLQPGLYGAPVQPATLPPQRMQPSRPQLFPPMLATAHAIRPYAPSADPAPAAPSGGSALGMARTGSAFTAP